MGRKKLEIKPILDNSCRQIAFCKRRKGLIKKARELSILCDVDVGVVIVSNRGRLHEFSSTNSMTGILQRYERHIEAAKEISPEIQVSELSKYSRFMTMGELLQATERQFEETNADGLTVTDLVHLENELQTTLIQTRSRKFCFMQTHLLLESVKDLHEQEKLLREENKLLEDNIAGMKKNRKVNEMSDLPPQRVTLNFLL
ncbi:transcription factor CAULIFLOWER D-like isoform X1 [Capsicum annuum]|uniref:truncated transcription factor CAULIFLOWER D-like isoform X1 n=1 Tax=Capsicum annuum TaxID=4072 RepID=UPI001FB09E68|nr:truncated transcription factor CAULIFLOWER D-like isoform X1 [Capsicum annuum]